MQQAMRYLTQHQRITRALQVCLVGDTRRSTVSHQRWRWKSCFRGPPGAQPWPIWGLPQSTRDRWSSGGPHFSGRAIGDHGYVSRPRVRWGHKACSPSICRAPRPGQLSV